jgi:hypothetical protein
MNFKLWLESEDASMGIHINDSEQPFTTQILNGQKTIETRNKPTLHPLINTRVGIIRTGVGKATLVGYATIGKPIFYNNEIEFDKDYKKHLVAKGSTYYIGEKGKWGYPLKDIQKIPEKIITTQVFNRSYRKLQ